ncbi:MAG: ribonuclease R [Saprospiraceae bacterium]|nr:MAG: ribonuclease R [Saprospiraceae bacterium]
MTKKKKTKIKGTTLRARQLKHEVLRLLKREQKKPFAPKQIGKTLKINNNKDSIKHALDELVEEGKAVAVGELKYKFKSDGNRSGDNRTNSREASKVYEGIVDMTRTGSAYIVVKDYEHDVHVAAKHMNTAMNGDRVKIRTWISRGRRKPEGEVLEVLERTSEHFIGTLNFFRQFAIVSPDGNLPSDIVVELDDAKGAAEGDKVVVKVVDWKADRFNNLKGVVTSVLGEAGSHDIEMKAILINNGFNLEFPDRVMVESIALSEDISPQEISRRRDMREVTTFTIDPDTARDFDDALSIQTLENGRLEIGVHIADVSHYVLEGSALDEEALKRSTSVYLVDRVLPMLPEKLSNELCSLRPNEDKLTFSAIFEFDKNDRLVNRWFGKTVIHSDRRFTYEEAQERLENKEGDYAEELERLNKLAYKLRRQRFKKGAINFETEEVKFRLDENGVPVEVYVKERKDAHMLIEDFMLLANREVAAFIDKKGKDTEREIPYVYRIHDEPNPDKVEELALFAKELGFEMKIGSPKEIANSYNALSKAAEKDAGLKLLEPLAIRTMAKAEYSTENIGHYGLAFDYYAHFTSPIRRYSDVLAHRILEKNLGAATFRLNKLQLEEKCKHISKMERQAMAAERESIKYKQVEFLEKHVGEVFPGIISGMIDRGIFVELVGNRCEGMVGFETMDEPFEMSEGRLQAKGKYSNKVLKMGDSVQVRITAADLHRRRIDMVLEVEEKAKK